MNTVLRIVEIEKCCVNYANLLKTFLFQRFGEGYSLKDMLIYGFNKIDLRWLRTLGGGSRISRNTTLYYSSIAQ